MKPQEFKVRASSAGKLTTQPRSKKDKEAGLLSKTVQTFAQDWLKERLYGVKKSFSSKYTEKGTTMEDEAIEMAINWLDLPVLTQKNEKHFEDDYFMGTPDIILDNEVIDIKCSWDCFSFPLFEEELPEKLYYSQVQAYMELVGVGKARVVYVLVNTPEDVAPWEDKHDYNDVDPNLRYKEFSFDYDPDHVEFLQGQVRKVRNYLKTLKR